ncbi:MAG: cupin domain-containing protein [Rubrobacteraceae bacterium]|nr:cupin domain-containing protein [Rubrobacteraceae bacterium]
MGQIIRSYREKAAFQEDRFNAVMLGQDENTKALLVCCEPGQYIPVHRPGVAVTFVVLEGEGTLVAGEKEEKVGPGAVAFAAAGEERGLKAETRLLALHVVAPPPTGEDHAGVVARLEQGVWRQP